MDSKHINRNLANAKKARKTGLHTQLADIERELRHCTSPDFVCVLTLLRVRRAARNAAHAVSA